MEIDTALSVAERALCISQEYLEHVSEALGLLKKAESPAPPESWGGWAGERKRRRRA